MVKVGIQLFSVRNQLMENPQQTLEQVVKTGYRYLESANDRVQSDLAIGCGLPTDSVRSLTEGLGAKIISAHISPLDPDHAEQVDRVLEEQQKLGVQYVATNIPGDIYGFEDRESTLRCADFLNKMGALCAKRRIQLLYHNHFMEFRTLDGESAFDLIMKQTDPDLLKIELDTYWALRGGMDPVALMRQYGKRVKLLHIKDYPKGREASQNLLAAFLEALDAGAPFGKDAGSGQARKEWEDQVHNRIMAKETWESSAEAGNGILDIQSIIDVANSVCEADYLLLEQGESRYDMLESIRISMENLKKYTGIAWD